MVTIRQVARLNSGSGAPKASVAAQTKPADPINAVATVISDKQINLTWSPGATGPAPTSYTVERSPVVTPRVWTLIYTGATAATSATGLTANTSYEFRVRAFNATSPSDGYATAIATTLNAQGSAGYQFPDGATPAVSSAALTGVATFHNIGLYWGEPTGSESNEALVRFKKSSENTWRQGLSLWYDARTFSATGQQEPSTPGTVPFNNQQYRGSLVELEQNTTYDVEVMTQASGNRKIATAQITTWNETFPIGSTVTLPASQSSTYNISTGGSPGAYRLYQAAGGGSTIDGIFGIADGVVINASYVIVRGLTIKRVTTNGIRLAAGVHDVVIENCDISNFGSGSDGNAGESHGIGTSTAAWPGNSGITRLVIQNNLIRDPAFNTVKWPTHPTGSDGIFLKDTSGNSVIRYNTIRGTATKYFSDGIATGQDFSPYGPLHNSDVYGNELSFLADDGIEAEGGNMNVRIYNNHVFKAFTLISNAGVSMGPSYVFRNVVEQTTKSGTDTQGNFYKILGKTNGAGDNPGTPVHIGGGRVYLFHNTLFATVNNAFNNREMGLVNIVSRNNIYSPTGAPNTNTKTYMNFYSTPVAMWPGAVLLGRTDFNYDIFTGTGWTATNREVNGISGTPTYDAGTYQLTSGSIGRNAAVYLPNFNDQFTTPDMGAQERGAPAIIFGTR